SRVHCSTRWPSCAKTSSHSTTCPHVVTVRASVGRRVPRRHCPSSRRTTCPTSSLSRRGTRRPTWDTSAYMGARSSERGGLAFNQRPVAALAAAADAHLFAVLGDRAASNAHSVLAKFFDQLLVAERIAFALLVDQFLQPQTDRVPGDV